MVFINALALVNYCRNAGNPYLNDLNKKYVRKFKLVIVTWNIAFMIKFAMSSFGVNIIQLDDEIPEEEDFWYSIETFAEILFTELIPYYTILDKKIV